MEISALDFNLQLSIVVDISALGFIKNKLFKIKKTKVTPSLYKSKGLCVFLNIYTL